MAAEILESRAIVKAAQGVLPEVMESELGSAIQVSMEQAFAVVKAKADRWEHLRKLLTELVYR